MSLCSQSFTDAVKRTHRIGTLSFCANLTQTARVSGSAFVLSDQVRLLSRSVCGVIGVPVVHTDDYTGAIFNECSSCLHTVLALFQVVTQRSKAVRVVAVQVHVRRSTYSLQDVLIHPAIPQWLKVSPIVRRFPGTRAATQENDVKWIRFRECRCCVRKSALEG